MLRVICVTIRQSHNRGSGPTFSLAQALGAGPEQCALYSTQLVFSLIPDSGESGMGMPVGANWGWWCQWGSTPDPRQIGDGDGDGDRGFRALAQSGLGRLFHR